MKNFNVILILPILVFHFNYIRAQNPLVKQWDYRYGGISDEQLFSFQQTADGGYILGGNSYSGIGGDKSQPQWGGADYWIVKLNALGIKEWDRDFGGTNAENFSSVQQTTDGGFIIGGYSYSGIGGDKTQDIWGGWDYWIIKTDSLGNKQWDKDFGGTSDDMLHELKQTADGGYILGGTSISNISGDKTQALWGYEDFWIVKIDSLGNKQWDKDYGGTNRDYFYSVQQTTDSGYIFGGHTYSGISGDKTQWVHGLNDYWIIKIDSVGNKQWDKDFGGTDYDYFSFVQQTSDNGFVLAGLSGSGIGGDKTQPVWGGANDADLWIVKTDSIGNKQWDKDFGGTLAEEFFGKISQTADGGYLIAGTSYSNISGDKTENNSLGTEQTWIIKTDALGIKQWDKTILSPGHDELGFAIQTKDGCYAAASWDDGTPGGYKTQTSWGGYYDYWIVKFCDTTAVPIIAFTSPPNLCPGTCTNFTNLSFNATSYQWSFSGATPPTSTDVNPTNICYANSGSYDVQLIATNANGSDTLLLPNYITVYPTPPPQSITQSGDTLFAVAGASIYQWYYNTNIINAATNYFYVALQSGDYNVVATDPNGCEVEAAIFNVIASAQFGVSALRFEVYPNPVTEKCTIRNAQFTIGVAVMISIYNMLGALAVQPQTLDLKPQTCIDVRELAKGIYYLEINSNDKTFRTKFVKQ